MTSITMRRRIAVALLLGAATATAATAGKFGDWSAPVSAEQGSNHRLNSAQNDGCPILSPDGLDLYFASTRPGGLGGIDIWVAHRPDTAHGWGAPVNMGAPVNSAADDFCPDPATKHRLFFVSKRDEPDGDIYVTTLRKGVWDQPTNLGANINSSDQEWSPSLYTDSKGREILYFSSTRPGGPGGQDIYASVDFGPAKLVSGLNTSSDDARPNVRHDGKEIVFDSTRPGTLGGPDLWTATRKSDDADWGEPVHLSALSSTAADTRATLSWDGTYLLFGSAREGGEGEGDLYVSTRAKK
jgi:Tol biopolymer transport system component